MTGVNLTGSMRALFSGKGHSMTVGYGRSGKGVTVVLPPLLDDSLANHDAPSFVVVDPKGENLAVSGNWLVECGYDVRVINPFGIPEIAQWGNDCFNPFDMFDDDDYDFQSLIGMMVNAISPPEGEKNVNSFFKDGGDEIIKTYLTYLMVQDKEPRTIRTLYRWLTYSGSERKDFLREMSTYSDYDLDIKARSFAGEGGLDSLNERYSNAKVALANFDDLNIQRSMSKSDFDIRNIPFRKTAVFFCVNPDDLKRVPAWLRLVMSCIMRNFTRYYSRDRKVVMIMDEFIRMGRLLEFESGMTYLGQYITLWPVIQDLVQLRSTYPNIWEIFVGNTVIKHWMVRDNFTAEYLEKRMPWDISFMGHNPDKTPRYEKKRLMTANDIMIHNGIIMEIDGLDRPAIFPERIPYWKFTGNYTPNPFY